MLRTYQTKDAFLDAVSSALDAQGISSDLRSTLLSGIGVADDGLRSEAAESNEAGLNLKLGAWIGWMRGIEPDWRRLARAWVDVMRFNNYPTKWRLRRIARSAGVAIRLASTDIDAGPRSKY